MRGFHGSHVRDYMLASSPTFVVGEFWVSALHHDPTGSVCILAQYYCYLDRQFHWTHRRRNGDRSLQNSCLFFCVQDSLAYNGGIPEHNQVRRRCISERAWKPKLAISMPMTMQQRTIMQSSLREVSHVWQDRHRQQIIDWINAAGGTATAFDVTTKGIMHAVFEACPVPHCLLRISFCARSVVSVRLIGASRCEVPVHVPSASTQCHILVFGAQRCEYWRLRDSSGKPPGVLGWWPSRATTFLENHDTVGPPSSPPQHPATIQAAQWQSATDHCPELVGMTFRDTC